VKNQQLINARVHKRWSPEEASQHVGVTEKTYRRWEDGLRIPQMESLKMLCKAFNDTPENLGYVVDEDGHIQLRAIIDSFVAKYDQAASQGQITPAYEEMMASLRRSLMQFSSMVASEEAPFTPPDHDKTFLPISKTSSPEVIVARALLRSISLNISQLQDLLQLLQNRTSSGIVAPPSFQNTSPQMVVSPSSFGPNIRGIMERNADLEGGEDMNEGRRNLVFGLVGAPLWLPEIGLQDLNADIQRVLSQPSSGPGDKELKFLEQKIMLYWQARHDVTIAPADLVAHVVAYVQEVKALLKYSLLPSIRTRLCACLSQGMFLMGASLGSMGQSQMAREYYQTALKAAYEANSNTLQALVWKNYSFSWIYSNEPDRYQYALDSMLKAGYFASLESDRAVDCSTQAALAEVYALGGEKDACLEALKRAANVGGYGHGDWYYLHGFDDSRLDGFRGICLQQFYQRDDSNTYPLLEESRQALQEASSQQNVSVRQRAFLIVDMAQVHAREGEVEAACNSAKQILDIAAADTLVLQRLLMVHKQLEPYADVSVVQELNREIRALSLAE
jgi:DNA-binding XRE family transcriptional regulator